MKNSALFMEIHILFLRWRTKRTYARLQKDLGPDYDAFLAQDAATGTALNYALAQRQTAKQLPL